MTRRDPALWRLERALTRTAERVGLYLIVQSFRVYGLITGRSIPS